MSNRKPKIIKTWSRDQLPVHSTLSAKYIHLCEDGTVRFGNIVDEHTEHFSTYSLDDLANQPWSATLPSWISEILEGTFAPFPIFYSSEEEEASLTPDDPDERFTLIVTDDEYSRDTPVSS